MTETRTMPYRKSRLAIARQEVSAARRVRLTGGKPEDVAYFLRRAAEYRQLAADASPDIHVYV